MTHRGKLIEPLVPAEKPSRGGPLIGWLGQKISGARSADERSYAVDRYYDLAIDPEQAADPAGAFRARVSSSSSGLERFIPEAQERLRILLGHFSAAQLLESSDALVWNVFGPFTRPRTSRRWLDEVLTAAFGPADYPVDWLTRLWPREEVSVPGMAATMELRPDATIAAPGGWRYVVAAQWQSDFADGFADALSLHASLLKGADPARSGLLIVVPSPPSYPPARNPESVFRRYFMPAEDSYVAHAATLELPARVRLVTWESMGERSDVHPHGVELRAYIGWRLKLLSQAEAS